MIDARFRILYPNLTIGDVGGTVPVGGAGGLVWSYALSNTLHVQWLSAGPSSAAFAPATVATGINFGFFSPLGIRFDGAVNLPKSKQCSNGLGIVNPLLKPVTLDMFIAERAGNSHHWR